MRDKFWMVYTESEQRTPPVVRHETCDSAKSEAGRLSMKLSKRIYVLEVIASCVPTINVTWDD